MPSNKPDYQKNYLISPYIKLNKISMIADDSSTQAPVTMNTIMT